MIYIFYSFIICALVALDQFSKKIIVNTFNLHNHIEVIPDFFNITYEQNSGAGFSILENQRLLFIIITVIAVLGFLYLLISKPKQRLINKISYLLIIGGALGNFMDRVFLGYVVDFLDFYIFGYNFPVFNLADTFLTIGVGLYIISILTEKKNAKN